uniref:Acyl-CoA thioesterase 9, tandem duplicate 1 n=1 Tax=Cyprinus carpio TaxID=7962 RepID=A0A8C2Q3D0_CYPCA
MFSPRALKSASSLMCRGFFTGQMCRQGKAPDMAEGNTFLLVSNVRNRLREIVGASTNWKDHQQALAERASLSQNLAKSQDELPAKTMKDSAIEAHLPLGTQPALREKYLNYHNSVRLLICYSHTWNKELKRSPLSIVTALVDKIDMRKNIIYPDCDIKFTGHVTWVGKTSIEAKMHMSQYHDGAYTDVLDATFVMVARDPENKRAAFINPLKLESPEEEAIFQQGEINKMRRVELSTASLLKVAPTAEERTLVHSLFLNTLDTRTVSFRSRVLPPNSMWMEDAKMKGLEICHPQERNIFNRIFGGFLMRKAYELGWANACAFVDQRWFLNGIHIQHSTTNVFHFTFRVEKDIPAIVPQTYGESMLYLDGKRHFDETMRSQG